MYKTIIFLFATTIFVLGCSELSHVNVAKTQNVPTPSQCQISESTAIVIAKGLLVFDYDLRLYETLAVEKTDSWEISFLKEAENGKKYGPVVELNKRSGERIFITHSK